MSRLVPRLAALLAAMALPTHVAAADWATDEPDLRGAFYSSDPKDWTDLGDQTDSMGFEFGIRYWYSWGAQSFTVGGGTFTSSDNAHLGELHLRIDDQSTRTYVKGLAGYSMAIGGTYDSNGVTGSVTDGHVGYAGADIGWNALGDNDAGFGALLGYMYWSDSPNTTRESFTTATSAADITWSQTTGAWSVPMDSDPNNIDIHALRLGVQGRAEFGEMFDITAEVAAVPYAKVDGTLGAFGFAPFTIGSTTYMMSSPATLDGWGYGAMGELMLGVQPIENLTFRVGGRAWYLQGTADATYSVAEIGDATDSDLINPPAFDTAPTFANQSYITTGNPFSLLRYGLLAELTYKF
ncbi:MAG: hypothetical protein Q8L54_10290 [Devosia sp.]|nr:hypothetical protein [Devosia sp.]